MNLIIDIPEETYQATCNGSMLPPDVKNVVAAIKDGIQLPDEDGILIETEEWTMILNSEHQQLQK